MYLKKLAIVYKRLDDPLIALAKRIMGGLPLRVYDSFNVRFLELSIDDNGGLFGAEFQLVPHPIVPDPPSTLEECFLHWSGVNKINPREFDVRFTYNYLQIAPKRIRLSKKQREEFGGGGLLFNIYASNPDYHEPCPDSQKR